MKLIGCLCDGLCSFGRSLVSKVSRPGQERVLVLQTLGKAAYCYVCRVLTGKVGSAGNICVFVFWHFVNYP